jgi:hypothetical protein
MQEVPNLKAGVASFATVGKMQCSVILLIRITKDPIEISSCAIDQSQIVLFKI